MASDWHRMSEGELLFRSRRRSDPIVSTFNPELHRVGAGRKRPGCLRASSAGWQALYLFAGAASLSGLKSIRSDRCPRKHRSPRKLRECQPVVLEITAYHETDCPAKLSPKNAESKGVRPVSSFEVLALCVLLMGSGVQ